MFQNNSTCFTVYVSYFKYHIEAMRATIIVKTTYSIPFHTIVKYVQLYHHLKIRPVSASQSVYTTQTVTLQKWQSVVQKISCSPLLANALVLFSTLFIHAKSRNLPLYCCRFSCLTTFLLFCFFLLL